MKKINMKKNLYSQLALGTFLLGSTLFAQADQVINDDLIVKGSECIGVDCVNGESFGFDTLRLKENNLRINFDDTSTSASFPSNDWRIIINDSSNGGASYFRIEDSTAGRSPFQIDAGAPSNSLRVDSQGDVGIGASAPVVELHVKDGDSPTLRLEQDGSSGFTPQTWDVAGNEANFFVRDVTNGSQLPFKIKPGADTGSLFVAADGDIGMGTESPGSSLHVRRTNGTSLLTVEEVNGTTAKRQLLNLKNNGDIRFTLENTAADSWDLLSNNDGFNLTKVGTGASEFILAGNGNLEIAGVLTENSDVNSKENIVSVSDEDVLAKLEQLPIARWNYKDDDDNHRHLSPMAQDFYAAFGLGASDKKIATLDMAGVALAAIKELQVKLQKKDEHISELQEKLQTMDEKLNLVLSAALQNNSVSVQNISPVALQIQ